MLNIYQIDDGATHTVAARDEAQAFGLYIESLVRSGMDWPDEKPSIEKLDDQKDYTLHPDGTEHKIKMKIHEWRMMFGAPQYVGCSEF